MIQNDPGQGSTPDEYRDWTQSANQFNNQIRDTLIHALIALVAVIIAHFKLKYWRRPLNDELPDLAHLNDIHDLRAKEANKNDHIVYRIGQFACTFGVSVGFLCLSLVPLSVLSNELKVVCLDSCPDWWLEWLTADLILGLWSRVSILCSAFLFCVLPASYLLIEADGFSFGPRHGLRARLYETCVIFMLLAVLTLFFFSLILVVSGSFDLKDGWISVIPRLVFEVTPLLRSWASMLALFSLLCGTYFGQTNALITSTKSIMAIKPKENVQAELRRMKLEQQHIQRRIKYRHRLRRTSASPLELKRNEKEISLRVDELENLVNQSWMKRFLVHPLQLFASVVLMVIGIGTSVFRTVQILLPFLSRFLGFDHETYNLRFSQRHFGKISLAHNYGYFQFPVSVSKFFLSIWVTRTSIYGLLKIIPKYYIPQYLATPLYKLILQCFIWLLLCSAVPLLSGLLTGLPLPIDFSGSPFLIGSRFQILVCLFYSVHSCYSIVQFLPLQAREKLWEAMKASFRDDNRNKRKTN